MSIGIVAFVAVLTALSWVRLLELVTSTWDLGIYQQALWSGGHGGPFYESADYETGGFGSFLQVHSAFVLYAIAPVYVAFPSPATLFVLQASVVALAAVPLYRLVRDLGGEPRRGAVAVALYLVSSATVSSTLYDFHIESFLPLEIFTIVLLWNARRYALGSLVVLASFLTMEAAPILTFAVGLFFLAGELRSPPGAETPPASPGPIRNLLRRLRKAPTVAALALALASVAAYYVLLAVRLHYLSDLAGFPPFPVGEIGYVIGGTPASLGLSLAGLGVGFYAKTAYWLTVFALVLFLPLRAPRSVLLALPWIAFTFLASNLNYVTVGFQYGFLVAASVFPGVAFGLAPRGGDAEGTVVPVGPLSTRTDPRSRRRIATVLLLAVVALNLALTPVNPLLQGSGPGSAFQLRYEIPPGYGASAQVAGLVPPGAPVLASDLLFPLVANDVHAFSLFWQGNPYLILPFNASDPPGYVLLAESRLDAVPDWLAAELYNPGEYGMRAVAWTTPVGAVLLFERGYAGSTLSLGPPPPGNLTLAPASLGLTSESWIVAEPGTPFGEALETVPSASGQLWGSSGFDLPSGQYRFTFWVKAWPADPSAPPSGGTTVLELQANPFAQGSWFFASYSYADLANGTFTPVTLTVTIPAPAFHVVLRGFAPTRTAGVGLSEILVTRE